jgi:pyruvate kinase
MRKTKIICTLGPAVDTKEMLIKMVENGMNCCRLNFSHGTHAEHEVRIKRIKEVREEMNISLPIMLDTKGPEIRVRDFKDGIQTLTEGSLFRITPDDGSLGDATHTCITYPRLAEFVHEGDMILVDDGSIELEVVRTEGKDVITKVLNTAVIKNHKSINVPNVIIDQPFISETDKEDLIFGCQQGVDYVAASFTRRKEDVLELRKLLDDNGGKDIKIICKIENTEGIQNMNDIIETADGVMVARGDMGVEVAFKYLPAIQKDMISKCYRMGKIVVTATQMLDSMQHNPRPTRAEVSDVANAIYDRTTAIMLSGESAAGKYPVDAVKTMDRIAKRIEQDINYTHRLQQREDVKPNITDAVSHSTCLLAADLNATAIVTVTKSGRTAQMINKYRPASPIIAGCIDEQVWRQMGMCWGVTPILVEEQDDAEALFNHALERSKAAHLVKEGDVAVLTAGVPVGISGTTNLIKAVEV